MLVFTNGCFDILHPGHVDLLERARKLGSRLIVGINSDESARRIKGPGRPFMTQDERGKVLMGLKSVDEVRVFEESTPEELIKEIKPDILVKGGDWSPEQIVGSEFVLKNGGQVQSLPLLDGYSSSSVVSRIRLPDPTFESIGSGDLVWQSLNEHDQAIKALIAKCSDSIRECGSIIVETVLRGGKILVCGNGGSAADSQHIAAEFVGRYETERRALPAIALTTDTSALTALANDYGFERVFSRQVEALANEGDCLITISTSGNSPNILAAAMAARSKGCRVIGMTGANGKKLAGLSDASLLAPSIRTARIQEAHILVAHIWCEMVDASLPSD
jgi:D-sedoheptulose 7-phosphate isomerase